MWSNTVVLAAILLLAVLAGACEKSFFFPAAPTAPSSAPPAPPALPALPDAIAINGTTWIGLATVTDCQDDLSPLLVSEVAEQCNVRGGELYLAFFAPDSSDGDVLTLVIHEGGSRPFIPHMLRRSPVDENGNFTFTAEGGITDQFRSGVGQIEWEIEKTGSAQVSPFVSQITGGMTDVYIGIVTGNPVHNGVYTVTRQWEFTVFR